MKGNTIKKLIKKTSLSFAVADKWPVWRGKYPTIAEKTLLPSNC